MNAETTGGFRSNSAVMLDMELGGRLVRHAGGRMALT
jgi:hypothetical protein